LATEGVFGQRDKMELCKTISEFPFEESEKAPLRTAPFAFVVD